jgi:hypothetical protein
MEESTMEGMKYTGKVFYIVEGDTEVLANPPAGHDFETWREAADDEDDDVLLYIADGAGIVLGFEEFWG